MASAAPCSAPNSCRPPSVPRYLVPRILRYLGTYQTTSVHRIHLSHGFPLCLHTALTSTSSDEPRDLPRRSSGTPGIIRTATTRAATESTVVSLEAPAVGRASGYLRVRRACLSRWTSAALTRPPGAETREQKIRTAD